VAQQQQAAQQLLEAPGTPPTLQAAENDIILSPSLRRF